MQDSKIDEFFKEIKHFPPIDEYFSQFQIQELFSNDCEITHQILEKLNNFPNSLLDYNKKFNSSFLAKYISISLPSEITDLLLMDLSYFLEKLTNEDLNFIVPVIASRLNEVQKAITLFNFPDCAATFILLTTLFNNENYFILAFQRIYSSYTIIPQVCRSVITSSLRLSLIQGPARSQLLSILSILIQSYSKKVREKKEKNEISPFESVLEAIIDGHPKSTELLKSNDIEQIVTLLTAVPQLPYQTLIFFELIKVYPSLSDQQVFYLIQQSPEILFDYIKKIPLDCSEDIFASVMTKIASIPMKYPHQDFILNIYKHFLLFSLEDQSHIRFIFQSNVQWFYDTLKQIKGSQLDAALFGINLLLLRCFNSYSNIVLECANFSELINEMFNRFEDKILFIDTFIYSLDPENIKCPFEEIVQLEILQTIQFPPPSLKFIFKIVPIIINALISTSTQSNQKEDEIVVSSSLKHLMKRITELYKNNRMCKFLSSISKSENLNQLIKFAEKDEETFKFLSLTLGFSCNFDVFNYLFNSISKYLSKTLKFLSFVAEGSQLVTEFLYINREISMPLSQSSTTIAMWVRPISGVSQLLQITANRFSISMRISPESLYPSETQEIKLPESIDGWYFITVSFYQFNTLLLSVNLTTIRGVYQNAIFPCSDFVIGGKNANFELQSVRVFKTVLSDDDIYQLFSFGPNFNEILYRNFMSYSYARIPSFITENGFASSYYVPFISKLSKKTKYDTSFLSTIEYALLPPYNNFYLNSKQVLKPDAPKINFNDFRCYTFSFLNSLQCQGGIKLIIHFIAEVILKHPSLNHLLFSGFLKKVFNLFPVFNAFFVKTHAYELVGHLMWSGNTLASETIDLALMEYNDDLYFTNPGIIENWLFEGQLYFSEIPEVVTKMMNSLMISWNPNILVNVKMFKKIVNLLCGSSIHTDSFLNILYMFAVKLTTPEKSEINAKLVFDRLILCHFVFSLKTKEKKEESNTNDNKKAKSKISQISLNHEEIHPINTVYLVRILHLLLSQYPKVKLDLELFLPAIVTSVPVIQAEIIKMLIIHLEHKYLHFLSYILKELPAINEIAESISSLIDERVIPLSFVQMTTSLVYLISHSEFKKHALKLCSQATITTPLIPDSYAQSLLLSEGSYSTPVNTSDESNIAFNQAIECIAITEQSSDENLLHFDEQSEASDFISFLICSGFINNKYDLVTLFFCSIETIPKISIERCLMLVLFFMIKAFKIVATYTKNSSSNLNQDGSNEIQESNSITSSNSCSLLFISVNLDKIIEMSTNYVAFLVHKLRLTPGTINEQIISLLEEFSFTIIEVVKIANSNDSTSNLIYLLISMFHLKFNQNYIEKLSALINDIPKIQKQKRYQELLDRIEQPEMMIPATFQDPFPSAFRLIERRWSTFSEVDRNGLFMLSCRSIHHQMFCLNNLQMNNSVNEEVIDLWHSIFRSLQFPGSPIYADCPTKWMISDCSLNYKQRKILYPLNPSLDRLYESFWDIKYKGEKRPSIRLKLNEVLQFTPISFSNAQDVKFSSSAHQLNGISTFVGVLILTMNKIKFYRRSKPPKKSRHLVISNDTFCDDFISIKLCQINTIKLKKFHHQPTGIEVLCENNHSYIFSFENPSICDTFIETISQMTMFNINIIKSANMKEIQNATQKWIDGTMSNFDYLLLLNEQSGRSWSDLTQYPIFPWIIKDYKSKTIDLQSPSFYRDLSLPIFAQTEEQQSQCMKYYNTTSSIGDDDAHCVPNYFSNVGCTLYYLVRLEPFTDEEISFQGGSFDAADRTFQSFEISYNIMVSHGNKGSLELIPDFFFNHETLKNVNKAKFPDSILSKRVVNDVNLPPWASSPRELVKIMRESLESQVTSARLNEWIDLVWGVRRRGQLALEKFNVFQKSVYEFNVDEVIQNRALFKAIRDQIHNCGQAVDELFRSPHPRRNVLNELHNFSGNLAAQPLKKSNLLKKELCFAFNPDGWMKLLNDADGSSRSMYFAFRISNGNIECLQPQNIHHFICFSEEVAATSMDVSNNFIITGHKMPLVNLWALKSDKSPSILASVNCHPSAVTAVSFFGNDWPMIAAGHEDGYVSLFSRNPIRFLRSISMGFDMKVNLIRTSDLTGEFLIVQKQYLTLWTINGELVNSIQINNDIVDAVFTNFTDGLRTNFIFLLCENGNILSLNSFDMNIISYQTNNETKEKPISICFKVDSLYVQYADSSINCWKLI